MAGKIIGYTPPNPLPTYTDAQIVEALRTSYFNGGAPDASGDFPTNRQTQDWNGPTITYRLVINQNTVTTGTGNGAATTIRDSMSTQEQIRIAEAIETWDDFIAIDIVNDQQAGTAGHATKFFDVFYVSGGTTSIDGMNVGDVSGQAFAGGGRSLQTRPANNVYGSVAYEITKGEVSLGRNFNGGEFDGLNASGVDDNGFFDLSYGQRGYETVMHEMGHMLGLSHPGFYDSAVVSQANGVLFAQDNLGTTIMSYFGETQNGGTSNFWGVNASTPMVHDILAVQAIYGAGFVRGGDTTYGFGNTSGRAAYTFSKFTGSVFTIWDSGGTDTLNASDFTGGIDVDLVDGHYSSIGQAGGNTGAFMIDNIGIAFGAQIENAIGGSGNDVIGGNAGLNILKGNAGDDILRGGAGNDELWGGDGADYLNGGTEFDKASYLDSTSGVTIDLSIGKTLGGYATGDTLVSIEDIAGSAFNDQLQGNDDFNRLEGLGGNDNISGGAARDDIFGGEGNDTLRGDAGGDVISGGNGFDTVTYGAAVTLDFRTYTFTGEAQGDNYNLDIERYVGSDQADTMIAGNIQGYWFAGGGGDDQLFGGTQNDIFESGAGADRVDGGGGFDEVSYFSSNSSVTVDLSFGFVFGGHAQGDTLFNIENLGGSQFGDTLWGNSGDNTIYGWDGDDDINGFGGPDLMVGGAGNDRYAVDNFLDAPRESAGGGVDTVRVFLGPFLDNFVLDEEDGEIEWLVAGDAASTAALDLTGNSFGNSLIGNAGNNVLSGGGGDDFLYTDAGADILRGGTGFNTFVFHKAMVCDWNALVFDADIANDQWFDFGAIQGSAGNDTIRTGTFWGDGRTFLGMAGDDEITIFAGNLGSNSLEGGADNDALTGGGGTDFLFGQTGNDTLDGRGGADRMDGHIGNDTFIVNDAGDVVVELVGAGGGVDWVRTTLASYTLGANVEKLAFTDTGAHTGKGNALANTLNGNAGDDRFLADSGGNDVFSGGAGSDSMFFSGVGAVNINLATGVHGGAAAGDIFASIEKFFGSNTQGDTMRAGAGRAVFSGQGGADTLIGGNNTDSLSGGDGIDQLFGGAGTDTLQGGKGNDTMNGGSGADLFVYVETAASGGWGADTITDFQDGVDLIKIDSPGVADAFSDFTVTGNGTANVLIRLAAAPANSITLQGVSPITVSAADFLFY